MVGRGRKEGGEREKRRERRREEKEGIRDRKYPLQRVITTVCHSDLMGIPDNSNPKDLTLIRVHYLKQIKSAAIA